MRRAIRTCLLSLLAIAGVSQAGIVSSHGALKVKDSLIVNASGEPIQLAGMSMFWSGWMSGFYRTSVVNTLARDWKSSIIRAAMGVEGSSNYLMSPDANKKSVNTIVNGAIANDIYVIIDWHDHNANINIAEAKAFFSEMAQLYKNTPNVIWEIWNEPDNKSGSVSGRDSWSRDIRPYAEEVIAEIRKYSSNLVIVGTPNWSQDVDSAAKNPVTDTNTAYALHFYAGSHSGAFRTKANNAMRNGAAVFITEWGTSMANGGTTGNPPVNDNYIDTLESNDWLDWAKERNISWCNWSVSNKDESSAALKPGASYNGGWPDSMLTPSGLYVRRKIREVTERIPVSVAPRSRSIGPARVMATTQGWRVQLPKNATEVRVSDLQGRILSRHQVPGRTELLLPSSSTPMFVLVESPEGLRSTLVTPAR
ncbi:MAG TPA: glycoside hydrolase family 5 protein [Fibrobacteria bacterium]|nr:glycoside hydrolase family 5 protein [Fibrobacteria bacterium]